MDKMLWKIDPRGNKFDAAFAASEAKHGLPSGMLRRMAYQESRFNPDALSPVGAIGILQFMPATAAAYKFNPRDPYASIEYAGLMMAQLFKQFGRWDYALAAYNWGSGNVTKWKQGLKTMPTETIAYMTQSTDLGINYA